MVPLPLVSPLRVEVESFVSWHNSFFDTRFSGPDQVQHTADSHHGQRHAEFKTSDKEINGLQDICVSLWAQELTDHRNSCLDLSGKGTAVLVGEPVYKSVQCLQGTCLYHCCYKHVYACFFHQSSFLASFIHKSVTHMLSIHLYSCLYSYNG